MIWFTLKVPKVLFVVGDSGKNIKDNTAYGKDNGNDSAQECNKYPSWRLESEDVKIGSIRRVSFRDGNFQESLLTLFCIECDSPLYYKILLNEETSYTSMRRAEGQSTRLQM